MRKRLALLAHNYWLRLPRVPNPALVGLVD
jgi:hypothetical protein